MNSIHNSVPELGGHEMDIKGPDRFVADHEAISETYNLKWERKLNCGFLSRKR